MEQEVIKAFNKRFPFIKVEMVRAPGGQLITRVKTEAAAGKLAADVVDHSDRALMTELADLFQDYAPPNGKDYLPEALISPKLWPRATLVWSIAYNTALVKKPPKTWMDLHQAGIRQQADRPGDRAVRRHDLDPHHVRAAGARRGLLEEAGGDQADALSLRRADVGLRSCAARSRSARCSTTSSTRRSATARRSRSSSRPRARRSIPMPAACRRRPRNPNAAKLFLNWCLSEEGQTFMIKELGNLTSLKKAPVYPPGFDPKVVKVWLPNFDQYVKLHASWIEEWNKTYGYRQ